MINIATIIVGIVSVISNAQTKNEMAYGAYLNTSKTMWTNAVKLADKNHGANSFEKAMALYGLLNNTMSSQDEETFDAYKEQTIELLENVIESNEKWGEPRAVLSAVYGLEIAYSPMKGMYLGMRSSSLIAEAMELQSESPLVQKLYGGSKLYTPVMFGGDPEMAVKSFRKSIAFYEETDTQNNWLYLDAMMGLSMALRKIGDSKEAIEILEKAVDIEPDYHWARKTLQELRE